MTEGLSEDEEDDDDTAEDIDLFDGAMVNIKSTGIF